MTHLLELVNLIRMMERIHCPEMVGMIWICGKMKEVSWINYSINVQKGLPGTCNHDPHSENKTNLLELVNMIRILE
jgi:hypothetical protein